MAQPRRARTTHGVALVLITVLALLVLASGAAYAAINDFAGGDGDQAGDCTLAIADWQCLDGNEVVSVADATGAGDDAFTSSKETEPGNWVIAPAGAPAKADILNAWSTATIGADHASYLDLAFHRLSAGGNTFVGFELNQSRERFTNSAGSSVPCRKTGDVLLSYEIGSSTVVKVFRWDTATTDPVATACAATGAFTEVTLASGGAEASVSTASIANFLPTGGGLASFAAGTFGEAAVNLRALADQVNGPTEAPCKFFRRMSVNTRSSSALDSSLQDWVSGLDVIARACETPGGGGGGTPTPPAAPVIAAPTACAKTSSATIRGSAVPGTTVTVLAGTVAVAFADADPVTGAWTAQLTNLADGSHSLTAEATDPASGLTSDRSAPITLCVDTTVSPIPPTGGGESGGGAAPLGTPTGQSTGVQSAGPTAVVAPSALRLGIAPGECAAKPFNAYVTLKGVRYVTFMVDGRKLRTVRKPDRHGQFFTRIDPAKLPAGQHRLTAKVAFRASGRKARVISVRFRKCDKCVSRRSFRIRVPRTKTDPPVSATVLVNGKQSQVVRGRRLTSRVRLTGLPKGRFTVKIRARLRSGKVVTTARKYRTCTPRTTRK